MDDPDCNVPLLVFADDWGRHPSSCQHLVRQLLNRHETYWVNTIGTRKPRLDFATLRRGIEVVRQWLCKSSEADRQVRNLRVLKPWMWPRFTSAFDRALNARLLARPLSDLIKSLANPPVAVTTLPIVAGLIDRLPVCRWVYYCVDDFAEWPGLDHAALRRMEEIVVRRSDVVIAVSESLREKLGRMGRYAELLTHGVDLDFWRTPALKAPLPQLAALERPLVVFWGVVDRRMDSTWVHHLLEQLLRGTLVLAGPVSDPDPCLKQSRRVVQLGPLPYDRLPQLAAEASVLVMPYADLPVTQAMQPLKLKEYLATGRPVVVRDLPATRDWVDCLDLAHSKEAFARAVKTRLVDGLPEEQRIARQRLQSESWAAKAHKFERWALSDQSAKEVSLCAEDVS
jgi:glycosyltransferase involved in cell wall biosynthesis